MFNPRAKLVLILAHTVIISLATISAQNDSGIVKNVTGNGELQSFDSGCGRVYTEKQFVLESPLYPSNYPLNYQCSYLIKGPSCPTYFNLEFLDFNVEASLGCEKDRLEIGDQDALCGPKSGLRTYFSKQGSLIIRLISDNSTSARGYRVIVSRFPCGQSPTDIDNEKSTQPTTTTVQARNNKIPDWYTTNRDAEYTTTTRSTTTIAHPVFGGNSEKCCQTSYTQKQFVITSPNFPYSMKSPTDCVYEIFKSNPSVCRLRIHVKFFFLGQNDQNCAGGFLQIDGRYICGCKAELKLISPFENDNRKFLKFVSRGYEESSYSGFVLEVIQDDCPKKYTPEKLDNSTGFRFYEDRANRVAFPRGKEDMGEASLDKLKLIGENTEIIDERKSDSGPKIIQHVYIFADPELNQVFPRPKDREETSYIHTTSSSSTLIPDSYDYNYCLNWNRQKLAFLPMRSLQSHCVTYNFAGSNTKAQSDCVDLSYQRGFFKSPYYPVFYPPNTNICYRFRKLPGFCTIRVYMRSFDLENSNNCDKDYLLFGNQYKYCGDRLRGTVSTLDMTRKPFEDIRFVTDSAYCGQGFFATYEQIQCQHPQDVTPTITLPPTSPALPDSNNQPCRRTIQDEMFTLDVFDYDADSCTFVIKKYNPDVCKVRLHFDYFNLRCAYESLVVDGTMYCGSMTGNTVTVDLNQKDVVFTYRRTSNVDISGLRFRIRGEQVTQDCQIIEVPPPNQKFIQNKSSEENSALILKMSHQFKEICGIVTNSTQTELPSTLCDLIKSGENNVTECLPLAENSLFVPLESQRTLELKIKMSAEKTEEIVFQEIDCDELT